MENQIANKIQIGRAVRFFAGYGGIDGKGLIVEVHGEPNQAPPRSILGGIGRVIQRGDCKVDVILEDGRRLLGINQCGIDAPGIGIKLLDEVHGLEAVQALRHKAAAYEAEQALERAQAKQRFEEAEAGRVITDPPVFFWNGIKDQRGAKLQKCWYSESSLTSYPDGTITIYARDYCRFSDKVRACFAVQNDTDIQVDYFDSDRIRVIPAHPLYPMVKAAAEAKNKKAAA